MRYWHDVDKPQPEKRTYLLLVHQNHQCIRYICFHPGGALCQTETGELIDIIDDAVRDSDAFKNVSEGVDTNLEAAMQNAWQITERLNISTSSMGRCAQIFW